MAVALQSALLAACVYEWTGMLLVSVAVGLTTSSTACAALLCTLGCGWER